MGIEKKFRKEIRTLVQKENPLKVLLAISGGMDSMVMGHLFKGLQDAYPEHIMCGVAHVNYGIRQEATEDAHFVQAQTEKWKFSFHIKKMVKGWQQPGSSLQATARLLRYQWFDTLRRQHAYAYIATAHHLDDSLETVLLQLIRGTGLAALRGVAPKRNTIIRPLHSYPKSALRALAKQRNWVWREDKSNATANYLRNILRKEALPAVRTYLATNYGPFKRSLQRLSDAHAICEIAQQQFEEKYLQKRIGFFHLQIPRKWPTAANRELLFATLRRFGLRYVVFETLCKRMALATSTGKCFETPSHNIYIDRAALHISPRIAPPLPTHVQISQKTTEVHFGRHKLRFRMLDKPPTSLLQTPPEEAYLHAEKLAYPLLLRTVQPADRFQPLGMVRTKKISDLVIDKKIPLHLKKNVLLLVSAGQIVWVVGLQMDARFALPTPSPKNILHIQLCPTIF